MNERPDIDRVLGHWFEDGPTAMPDRVVDVVARRIRLRPQRRSWRLLRRSPMRTPIAYGLAAAAVLVVAVVGFNLLPKSPSVGGPLATATTAPTETSEGSSSSPASTVVDASAFGVPLTLTLSGGWTLHVIEPTNLELFWGGVDLGFHPLGKVTLPGVTVADPWIPVPADFVDWIQQRPEFTSFQTRPVTIGGQTGTEIDAEFVWKTGTPKRDFLRYTTGAWLYDQYAQGNKIRFVYIPGPSGDGFIIVMNAGAADFDAAAAALDVVLGTVQFHAPTAYQTRSFEVPLALTLVAGWTTGAETTGNLELRHSDLSLDPGIQSIASLRAPSAPGRAPEPWPTDFRAWLANQPEFTPGPPVSVTVGGRPGTQVDVDVSLSATDAPRTVLTGEGFDWKTVTTPERWRLIVVETGPGAGIVIVMPSAPEKFDAAATALDYLLGTLVFR